MAWQALFTTSTTARYAALPLVLCGPILRKTMANEVSVWIALKSLHVV